MNETQEEKFRTWASAQPGHVTYSNAKNFLSDLLDVSNAEAEFQLAKMAEDERLEIIQTTRTKRPQKRIFLKPLEPLSESDFRKVWDGSKHSEIPVEKVIGGVRDRTGHKEQAIMDEIRNMDKAEERGGVFRWLTS